ncbi:hypothetical protein [Noviherbaspirillum aridicola]|uniref:Uncharacterized protein n=1 Tax=Noviherbaspirillum aridicola TaxID=2849687 RepID=A0ABQ4Q1U8_9BURK|nr:hypothetical protein [Noviherbaspirillum aridicola]GIZ51084.1 hypothetical protein NCCP691_10980 [Noviherbaspirillum aridicola]
MHHTLAYLAIANGARSVPSAQRGYLLRSQMLLVRELTTLAARLEEEDGCWDMEHLIARAVTQAMPGKRSDQAPVAAVLRAHASALWRCVDTDFVHACRGSHPLDPVKASERARLPKLEALYFLGPEALAILPEEEKADFVACLQAVLCIECEHSVLVFRRNGGPAHQLLIHYSAAPESEELNLAASVQAMFMRLLAARRRAPGTGS